MSNNILNTVLKSHKHKKKLFAVLIDPEKCSGVQLSAFIELVNKAKPDFIFVGGSQLKHSIDLTVKSIKSNSKIPVVLFIGDAVQFTPHADAMLFLSLISGRNPDFLIGQHVRSAKEIKQSGIATIPTGYILVDGGRQTAVEQVSATESLADKDTIVRTAIAGELLGQQLIYLEAGSGAKNPVSQEIIAAVRAGIDLPLIVGGGVCSPKAIEKALDAGADLVVVGNHLEKNPSDLIEFVDTVRRYNDKIAAQQTPSDEGR